MKILIRTSLVCAIAADENSTLSYPGSDTFAAEQDAIDELVNGMVELLEVDGNVLTNSIK